MKGSVLLYSLVMAMSISAFGQEQVSVENQVLADSVQQPVLEVVNEPVVQTVTQDVQVQVQQPVQVQQQPIVLQNQPTNNVVIQKQPTTVVEDSPLAESRAEALRRQRIEMEQSTEAMIVEKLEAERMKAEQDRARKLMEDLDSDSTKKDQEAALEQLQEQEVAPVVEAVPVATEQVVVSEAVQEEVKAVEESVAQEEVKTESADVTASQESDASGVMTMAVSDAKVADESSSKFFLGLDVGYINYNLDNMNSLGAFGVRVGVEFDKKYVVEGGYSFSKFNVESVDLPGVTYYDYYRGTHAYYPVITEMRQHNFKGAFKFKPFGGDLRFSPYAGGLLSVTYRDYDITQDPVGMASRHRGTGSSLAMDLGLVVGTDLKMTEAFSLNFNLDYIFNLSYDLKADGFQTSRLYDNQFGGRVIEEAGYWQIFVGGTFTF